MNDEAASEMEEQDTREFQMDGEESQDDGLDNVEEERTYDDDDENNLRASTLTNDCLLIKI